MKKEDFNIDIFAARFTSLLEGSDENTHSLAKRLGLSPATISRYANGIMAPKVITLYAVADIFNVNPLWLMGFDVPKTKSTILSEPNITSKYTTFPVIGEIAAGYNFPAIEDWSGDTVEIPDSFLSGKNKDDFFVLKVKGDSMYPTYHDGDCVLVRKQPTLNYSGEVGAVLYDDEYATLKRVEYKQGEDWLKLIPINPAFPPERIEGERLEHCRIIGLPVYLIRRINE